MRIGIDLDGCAFDLRYTKIIELFLTGNEIFIVSAHNKTYYEKDKKLWEHLYKVQPKEFHYLEGYELVGEFKRRKCKELQLDILIDDFGGNNPKILETFLENGYPDTAVLMILGGEGK